MTTRTRALATAAALAALALAGCGGSDSSSSTPNPGPASTSRPAPKATVDPYDVYMKLAPKGAPNLSREDAQARAFLGCGQPWAPGTVDAALAEAYADLCKRGG